MNKGFKHTEETKRKISLKNKGRKLTEEHKTKLRLVNLNKKCSNKTKKKISLTMKRKGIKPKSGVGRKFSKEWWTPEKRKEASNKLKKKREDPIFLEKLRQGHIGKKYSEETKMKMSIAHLGEKSYLWRGGISKELYGLKWTSQLKKDIRNRDKFICAICRKNGWCVHHIDYNKKNCNPSNLITLCNSCHMKTNFDRENWIKYFGLNYELKREASNIKEVSKE